MNTLLANIENLKKVNSENNILNNNIQHNNIINNNILTKEKEQISTPLLPIDGLPEYLQNFISEYVNVYNIPRDYIAASVLFSTALAIGDKFELQGKYKNVPVFWLSIIGDVSTGKTDPLRRCLDFFNMRDSLTYKKYKLDLEIYNSEMEKPKKERDALIQRPQWFQYILNDYTPEALARVHSTNNRGLCIYRDELKGWLDDFGRYAKSGEQSNMLSSFFGVPIKYNRAGTDPINIEKPCIFPCGGIQPDLLSTLANDNRAENGFLSRFVHVYPDNQTKPNYSHKELKPEVMQNYYEYLSTLADITETQILKLSFGASKVYEKWYNKNAEITNSETIGYLKGVYGKLDVISLRLAIVVYGMNLVCCQDLSTEISESTMLTAINLTEYFRSTALKVYKKIFIDNNTLNKKDVIKYCHSLGASQNEIALATKVSQPYIQKILK